MNEIDSRINYKGFYSGHLHGLKSAGDNELLAKCPFHQDTHASMTINTDSGVWKCHACGEQGNAQTFLEKHQNITSEQAIDILKAEAGIPKETKKPRTTAPPFTIDEYCRQKKLSVEFIESLNIRNLSRTGIAIPYMDESGNTIATRYRHAVTGGSRFSWARGSKVQLYGLWRLPEIRKEKYVVLVEGESDAQTLWTHGLPALGVPGASVFHHTWVSLLMGLDILIHKEPDIGGETFLKKICEALVDARYTGTVKVFSLGKHKDPSDLHLGEDTHFKFLEIWKAETDKAEGVNFYELANKSGELITGAPLNARRPAGWQIDESRGVSMIDAKGMYVVVCPVPVLLSRRLQSIDTGEEKIELSFRRDGQWKNIITNRSTVFQRRTVTTLTDKGLPLTSERAGEFVKFLGEMEAENLDILPLFKSTERLGWIDRSRFLPGLAKDIVLDLEGSMSHLANGYVTHGNPDKWKAMVSTVRENPIARFILATAFAAPLMRPLNHRIFIVHSWGDTRAGKTAALKAALSVWGDPEVLMANFNATRVGLERMAGFYNDLPLGIDERQVMGDKQAFVESLVYLLGLGKGKTRGAKGGGIQATSTWRCVVLTTGEDPLITESSQGGIQTRVLEIYGKPFPQEAVAGNVHKVCSDSFGHAGVFFVRRFIDEYKGDSEELLTSYALLQEAFEKHFPSSITSHVSAVALVSFADFLYSQWMFKVPKEKAFDEAYKMGADIMKRMDSSDVADNGERAWQYIKGWLASNQERFQETSLPPVYGYFEDGVYYVIPSHFDKALKDVGFNSRKVLMDFSQRGYLSTDREDGEKVFTVQRYFRNSDLEMIPLKVKTKDRGPSELPDFDNLIRRAKDRDDLSDPTDKGLPF